MLISLLVFYVVRKWSSVWSASPKLNANLDGGTKPFNWTAVQPSEEFEWFKCYDEFECARLSVPLDYSNPSGSKAAIAVIKVPANVSSSEKHGGPVLINPGGPGGSGVAVVLELGKQIQTIIGKQFDIIGFDPRAVGLTTPSFYAFSDKNEAGLFYIDYPLVFNTSTDALGKAYAYSNILGTRLEESSRNVTEHVSTPVVARDMLSISKAMGHDKLQYWGFSYGTVLGATFSAMFPDNVGRVVIDGVVDSENYYSGSLSNHLMDSDAALLDVCDACTKAGPEKCGLYENSAKLVLQRVNNLLNKLRTAPIPVYQQAAAQNSEPEYGIVSYDTVKRSIFLTLYHTHTAGAYIMNLLAELEKGNAYPFLSLSTGRAYRDLLSCDCPAPGHEPSPYYGLLEPTLAIACGDNAIEDQTFSEIRKIYEDMAMTSTFADIWVLHAACSGWKVKGKERFRGTFNHKTSHPLLLIGNTADPVTPLWSAHKMSKGFEGSVVLTQNSSGHCSISGTSLCTHKAIRAYFQNGTLPEEGTVCETESKIFGSSNLLDDIDKSAISAEDFALLEASYALQQNYFVPVHTLQLSGAVNWRL